MRERDVIDILAVWDVVQNLDVFKARVAEIKQAQAEYEQVQEIQCTVEEANKLIEKANKLVEETEEYKRQEEISFKKKREDLVLEAALVKVKNEEILNQALAHESAAIEQEKASQELKESNRVKTLELAAWERNLAAKEQIQAQAEAESALLRRRLKDIAEGV